MNEWIGFVAGALTTTAFLPQVLQIWRSRSAKDLSLPTFTLFTTGVFLWLVYGLTMVIWPIIIFNSITFILASLILFLKLRYG